MAAYDAYRQKLTSRLEELLQESFAGLAEFVHEAEAACALPHSADLVPVFEAHVPDIHALTDATVRAWSEELQGACQDVSAAAHQAVAALQEEQQQWHGLFEDAQRRVAGAVDMIRTTAQTDEETAETSVKALQQAMTDVRTAFASVSQAAADSAQMVSKDLRQAVDVEFDELRQDLSKLHEYVVPQAAEALRTSFEQVGQEFDSLGREMASSYAAAAQRCGDELARHAGQEMVDGLRQLGDNLKGVLLDRVATEIELATIETQVSVSLSTALGPIMPELIAFYKALDLLEEAVRVFHTLTRPFG
jgi:gas vesicle protein